MSDYQYQIALNAFNAVLRADPICRQLLDDEGRWGDIMYREDERNAAPAPGISLFDKMVAQQAALPPPVVQEYRSFPAPSPRMQQRQQVQRQQVQRQPVPAVQRQPVQQQKPQQKKRARNAFADLDEDSE